MTTSELSRLLSVRVADEVTNGASDGKRFSASQRIGALNSAVRATTNAVLARSTDTRKTHDTLQQLLTLESHTVNSTGKELSSFTNKVAAAGIKYIEALIGTNWMPCVERTVDELRYRRNQYLKGSDDYPTYYLRGDSLFVEVSLGTYPVDVRVDFVRVPKEMVYSDTGGYVTRDFELGENLIEPVMTAAELFLYKSTDEVERIQIGWKLFASQVESAVLESLGDKELIGGVRK